jgi:hypothetical protein
MFLMFLKESEKMKNKIILLSMLGVLAILLGSSAKAGVQYSSHMKSSEMPPVERAMWAAGCLKTKSDMKQTCVQTLCVKRAKDITGKLICAKQACSRIKETKNIACVQWGKPRTQKRGKRK